MDEPTPAMIERIQSDFQHGMKPSQILGALRAEGGHREIADYLMQSLALDPDSVSFIYAWLRNGISDEELDALIERTLPKSTPADE